MDLVDFFDIGAGFGADQLCLVGGSQRWTYRDMQRASHIVASAIRDHGVSPGAHFSVLMESSPASFQCVLGGLRAHLVWLPVTLGPDESRNAEILDHFDCEVVFYESQFQPTVDMLSACNDGVLTAVCIDREDGDTPGLASWTAGASDRFAGGASDWNDIVAILPTGGTTGLPKGAVHTHLDFQLRTASHLAMMPVVGRPRFLLRSGALVNSMAIQTWQMFVRGGTVYMADSEDVGVIAGLIEEHAITDAAFPVTALYLLLADASARTRRFTSLQHLVYATAPMAQTKLRDAISVFGPVVEQVYSQTETLAHITHFAADQHVLDGQVADDHRLLSCGRTAPMARAAIMSEDGELLPDGEIGEIVVRSPAVMKRYYHNPSASEEVSRFGWHHTGDAGYFDDEGFFYIVDRISDLITTPTGIVSPSRIERVILRHDAVRDCAVVERTRVGHRSELTAVAEPKPGVVIDGAALLDLCRAELGEEMTPASIEFWEELPRSTRGKVLKRMVRERLEAD
jgi:fatty-acyl-CoA synthase